MFCVRLVHSNKKRPQITPLRSEPAAIPLPDIVEVAYAVSLLSGHRCYNNRSGALLKMSILQLKGVSLAVEHKKILNNVTLDIWEGHVHAIVGPNGAGKSTLAYTIMGLGGYRQIEGEIIFNGKAINDLAVDARGKLGITLAWQDPARYEGFLVRDFIKAGAQDKSEKHVNEVLELAGLDPQQYADRAVDKTLSGGERKKIELASIVAMDAKLIMMDEPDSGIDVESLVKIYEIIRRLKQKGSTVLLITHSLSVLRQAEHAFLLCHGQVVDKGTVDKIIPYFENKCMPCDHINEPETEAVGEKTK
jgi:Fe-S cluster assembly ATP-binding protein